ncbi:MAG: SufD family Fe-S cluster assembly protein [Bacilli bacterium]|jgi:Fe-S cluster assembly protein SufD|nr:SufD family Fe-S cluster assembly protein [Bacilli bacterium]NLN80438.1 SufD family Fe-S cluster assembly protein [Erysipelotrichia bacterium]
MINKQITINECRSDQLLLNLEEETSSLHILLNKNSYLNLGLLNFQKGQKNKIEIDVLESSELELALADFSLGSTSLELKINLKEKGARASLKLATLSRHKDEKKFNIFFNHLAPKTYAEMDNYGVARHESKLIFSGANEIINGAIKSKTSQKAKIIVFDPLASGKANPYLNIYENDVMASHAAVVGKLSEDHLFYLMSRGLNIEEAKKLITYGYLMPIAQYFKDVDLKAKITLSIEEQL